MNKFVVFYLASNLGQQVNGRVFVSTEKEEVSEEMIVEWESKIASINGLGNVVITGFNKLAAGDKQ